MPESNTLIIAVLQPTKHNNLLDTTTHPLCFACGTTVTDLQRGGQGPA